MRLAGSGYSGAGMLTARPLSTPPEMGLTGARGVKTGGGGPSSTFTTAPAVVEPPVVVAPAGALNVTPAAAFKAAPDSTGALVVRLGEALACATGGGTGAAVFTTATGCGAALPVATCATG